MYAQACVLCEVGVADCISMRTTDPKFWAGCSRMFWEGEAGIQGMAKRVLVWCCCLLEATLG